MACLLGVLLGPLAASAHDPETGESEPRGPVENIVVTGRQPVTATSTMTIPADVIELYPLESGGQMLEAVPNLVTAQHTGGGKAEQYFIRGFDADHGTDLLVYFDGVPINLRSHAHGQGFLDLHFVTPESIERLDAFKGPYFARYGDFATAAAVEYVPYEVLDESFVKIGGGSFNTVRAVGGLTSGGGALERSGDAQGYLTFEAYHTDGPFLSPEDLTRYSAFARGHVDLRPDLVLSGHLLGYYGRWNASGLVPQTLVSAGQLDRFGSLDPTEGGESTRIQGKVRLDWTPTERDSFMMDAYVAWYDLELFSNFTYYLENDDAFGDGIVQRDQGRLYAGGRTEYRHRRPDTMLEWVRAGAEWRVDDASVSLATQTVRVETGCLRAGAVDPARPCNADHILQTSLEPYVDTEIAPLDWVTLYGGLRFSWLRFGGRNELTGMDVPETNVTRWLPKANLVLRPFSAEGPVPTDVAALNSLEVFGNFGIGYHSNDARAVFVDPAADAVPRATGAEAGLRSKPCEGLEVALDFWWLELDQELVFVGDEGITETAGRSVREGVELVASYWPLDWLYVRGDVAYTSARLVDIGRPVPQAPRFIARAATGIRRGGLAAEVGVRHLGDRYASDMFYHPRLSDYTVMDIAARYRWRFLEVGIAVENVTDTDWSSSEFYYDSRPTLGGPVAGDFHFSPGNPLNARVWVTGYF